MTPDWSVITTPLDGTILRDTARPVAEGVWYVDRDTSDTRIPNDGNRHGLFFTHSGSHVVSIAWGTTLHYHGQMDFETYSFVPHGIPDDVCCHETWDAAQACALGSIRTGRWCYEVEEDYG